MGMQCVADLLQQQQCPASGSQRPAPAGALWLQPGFLRVQPSLQVFQPAAAPRAGTGTVSSCHAACAGCPPLLPKPTAMVQSELASAPGLQRSSSALNAVCRNTFQTDCTGQKPLSSWMSMQTSRNRLQYCLNTRQSCNSSPVTCRGCLHGYQRLELRND